MRLLLIRHGQTPANVRGALDTGRPGPGLTALGRAQASSIPAALAGERIDAVFASHLVRTRETAAPLAAARGLEIGVLDGIHEIGAGELEMATDHDSYRQYLGTCRAWGAGDRARRMPGAESGTEFFARFDASIAQLSGLHTAAVFSHAAAMRVWVAGTVSSADPNSVGRLELDNTAMIVLEGSFDGGWQLESWRGEPLGGPVLVDDAAEDPAGEGIDELA